MCVALFVAAYGPTFSTISDAASMNAWCPLCVVLAVKACPAAIACRDFLRRYDLYTCTRMPRSIASFEHVYMEGAWSARSMYLGIAEDAAPRIRTEQQARYRYSMMRCIRSYACYQADTVLDVAWHEEGGDMGMFLKMLYRNASVLRRRSYILQKESGSNENGNRNTNIR